MGGDVTMASLSAVAVSNRVPAKEHMMFGASGLGCLYADVPPEDAVAVLDAVVAAGITYIDSAPWYGAGLSESRVGEYYASRAFPRQFQPNVEESSKQLMKFPWTTRMSRRDILMGSRRTNIMPMYLTLLTRQLEFASRLTSLASD